MKNIITLISVSAFAFLVMFAGMPSVAKATTNASGRSEFEIKIITQICNSFPEAWRMSSTLCQSVLSPAPTPGDTVAPTISDIKIRTIRAMSAEIMWQTSESTKGGMVFYSTTSGFSPTTDTSGVMSTPEKSDDYHKGHKAAFANLLPDTTYYYIVKATDKAGNAGMSAQGSFKTIPGPKTSPAPDTASPLISELSVSTNVQAKTATISWKTNENADSKIMYSTDIGFAGDERTKSVSDTGMSMNHSLTLSNLNTNTIYYFKAQSKDQSGNTGTSVIGSLFLAI